MNRLLPIFILLLFSCNQQQDTSAAYGRSVPRYVEICASLGYPTSFKNYDGAIESAIKNGITGFRIYDPFVKQYDTNVAAIVEQIRYLINDKSAKHVLIAISNNAYSSLKQDTVGVNLTKKQRKKTFFNNCTYPKDTAAHARLLKKFCNALQAQPRYYRGFPTGSLLDQCEFELGNEPDSEIHYWGTFEQYKELVKVKYNAIKDYDRPIYIGDFTASLFRDSSYKHKGQWMNYIEKDPIFNVVKLSNSFYWQSDSSSKGATFDFDVNENDYPNRQFTGQVISEYNLYTSFDAGSIRDSVFNSRTYGVKLCQLLHFIHTRPAISRIYIHPLCEFGVTNDATGNMGIWKKNFDPKTKRVYYTQKPACVSLYDIIGVIKTGYTVEPGKIIGNSKTVFYTEYNYSIN